MENPIDILDTYGVVRFATVAINLKSIINAIVDRLSSDPSLRYIDPMLKATEVCKKTKAVNTQTLFQVFTDHVLPGYYESLKNLTEIDYKYVDDLDKCYHMAVEYLAAKCSDRVELMDNIYTHNNIQTVSLFSECFDQLRDHCKQGLFSDESISAFFWCQRRKYNSYRESLHDGSTTYQECVKELERLYAESMKVLVEAAIHKEYIGSLIAAENGTSV